MDIGSGRDVQDEEMEADNHNKDRWAQALVNKMTAVTTAFRGAGDQRHAARRTYLQMAPDARTESYLESPPPRLLQVIDEVLYQSTALNRLTRNARMAVARRAHVVEFLPGETLCVRGSPQDALLVVMSGEVEVVDGHWDGTCPPPPQEHGRFGGLSHEATGYHTATYQHFPPQQQQYMVASPPQSSPSSQHPSRRHLAEQLSVSSGASLTSGIVSGPQPPATPLPLQLDSRHTIHPALQSHPSAHRRHVHNHFRPHSKTGARGGAPRCSGAGGTDGSNSAAGARSRVVLRRGDSLGAVDLGWLSRLPRSSAAATLEELPAAPSLTSRALLATRAEMASGGSISGQAAPGTNGGLAGLGAAGIGGSMLRSLAGGPGSGAVGSSGGRRRSSSTGVPPLLGAGSASGVAESGAGGDEAEGSGEREDGVNKGGSSTAGGRGEREGSIHGSNSDPLQRLRWACTAVAVGGRVECAAIGLQQLCAVVATEMHWDVESLVESLEELPVFAALSGVELRQLVRVLRLHTFSGGTPPTSSTTKSHPMGVRLGG
ncbi:hypothetical protein Vretimale_18470 [Volvox reticuliferus]|nr:hypothetical protein Vretimale_18470 [Volvox reticuliferus]